MTRPIKIFNDMAFPVIHRMTLSLPQDDIVIEVHAYVSDTNVQIEKVIDCETKALLSTTEGILPEHIGRINEEILEKYEEAKESYYDNLEEGE